MNANNTRNMDETFFREYTSHSAILKYTKATAGYGISYLLDHDYKDVYLSALESVPPQVKQRGIRMLEFGCGAGMNLLHLISVLKQAGSRVEKAVGTDFSPALIHAAKHELEKYVCREDQGKIEFHIAKNECLINDLSAAAGVDRANLLNSFDFILGVNTLRYGHRGGREMSGVRDILDLLEPGGVCVNIDMNNRFPAFRSALKNHFRRYNEEECYLPSLDEYAAPFEKTGFEVLRKENFCWIPHSSGRFLCSMLSTMTPILNAVAKSRAMRSLVVARKPVAGR
jgi:SAM-dependent methyltransferase